MVTALHLVLRRDVDVVCEPRHLCNLAVEYVFERKRACEAKHFADFHLRGTFSGPFSMLPTSGRLSAFPNLGITLLFLGRLSMNILNLSLTSSHCSAAIHTHLKLKARRKRFSQTHIPHGPARAIRHIDKILLSLLTLAQLHTEAARTTGQASAGGGSSRMPISVISSRGLPAHHSHGLSTTPSRAPASAIAPLAAGRTHLDAEPQCCARTGAPLRPAPPAQTRWSEEP